MANYITTLKEKTVTLEEEVARLTSELEAKRGVNPPTTTTHPNVAQDDYRQHPVQIAYGRGGKNFVVETLPLIEGFNRLVEFYDQFSFSPDRTVSREILDDKTATGTKINQTTVYAKMTYRDLHSKQMITTIREMPLWLAVDNQVQQNKEVEILSREEYQAWYDDLVMKERKGNRDYQRALAQKKLDQQVNAELAKEAMNVTPGQ